MSGSSAHVVVFMYFFFKHKPAYEMRSSDWSSDVCSSDLLLNFLIGAMRSMAWAARESEKEEPMIESMSSALDDGPIVIETRTTDRNAEETLLAREDYHARLKAREGLFHEVGRAAGRERVLMYV